MVKLNLVVLSVLLAGCTTTVVSYPSVCPNNDDKCQRNLDAQTLTAIGQTEGALSLMCMDPDLNNLLDKACKGE
jgi:hypothetical protein